MRSPQSRDVCPFGARYIRVLLRDRPARCKMFVHPLGSKLRHGSSNATLEFGSAVLIVRPSAADFTPYNQFHPLVTWDTTTKLAMRGVIGTIAKRIACAGFALTLVWVYASYNFRLISASTSIREVRLSTLQGVVVPRVFLFRYSWLSKARASPSTFGF